MNHYSDNFQERFWTKVAEKPENKCWDWKTVGQEYTDQEVCFYDEFEETEE
jgi:hypothetical protein